MFNQHRASCRQLGVKNAKASAHTHGRNYNFECDWLFLDYNFELFDNKMSNNKLSDNTLASELVESRSLF